MHKPERLVQLLALQLLRTCMHSKAGKAFIFRQRLHTPCGSLPQHTLPTTAPIGEGMKKPESSLASEIQAISSGAGGYGVKVTKQYLLLARQLLDTPESN